jgi:hypothetical protein
MDLYGGPDWLANLQSFMGRVWNYVRGNSDVSDVKILGPSLVKAGSYAKVGSAARQYFDIANLHNYAGGRWPGNSGWGGPNVWGHNYGSLQWAVDYPQHTWPGTTIWTTENGYKNNLPSLYSVPEDVSAIYIPRLLLEEWRIGVRRTYLYELVDTDASLGHFGLMRGDGSRKPAFYAVQNLISLLNDPGPSFSPGDLDIDFGDSAPSVRHMLFQKRSGNFMLAIWNEVKTYDPDSRVYSDNTDSFVNVKLPAGRQFRAGYRWQRSGNVIAWGMSGDRLNIRAKDRLLLLEIQ